MLADKLNLELAWKRHKKDLKDRAFSDSPYETKIIDDNFDDWIAFLKDKVNSYKPSRVEIVNIPKKNFHLRPGSILTSEDATIYNALLLCEIDKIRKHLESSPKKTSFAYKLKEDQSTPDWFTNQYRAWSTFREKSIELYHLGYRCIVFADVSAFFENISIPRLISDLRSFGISDEVIKLLNECLYRWAEPRSRGIPQGNSPSSILADVYFHSIDQRLLNNSIKFCRYVDDIRLFCDSKNDAIAAMHFLTVLLREKELNLQTGKSYILDDEDALHEIDNVSKILEKIEDEIKDEFLKVIDVNLGYATPSSIEGVMKTLDSDVKLQSIRRAFDMNFISNDNEFNKTLFHYCINRLGAAKDDYAVEYCMDVIINKPEEFENILPYFSKLEKQKVQIAERIINKLDLDSAMQSRHFFLLFRWLYQEKIISQKILELCREIAFNRKMDDYTKHYTWAILGEFGNLADLDAIEVEYSNVGREISKAVIICSIRRMIEERRNTIYARAESDGMKVKFAIKTAKQRT